VALKIEERKGHTVILLTREEVLKLCLPGEGANTCVWLVASAEGLECSYYNRPTALAERWAEGKTNAQRDGCETVKAMNLEVKHVEAKTLRDIIDGGG
jgi:hypothetical protein